MKFDSQRISNPDRIFFDLHDTKLASTLVGKTFDVDDGFLKKVRVAEFQPGRTRIVLEVDNLASYDAFLLPDPYRLIIDIHGKDVNGKEKRMTAGAAGAAVQSAPEMEAASPDADDDSSAVESRALPPGRTGEAPAPTQAVPTQARTNADNSGKHGLVETDLPAEDASAESTPPKSGKAASGNGVTKTTVEVKDPNMERPAGSRRQSLRRTRTPGRRLRIRLRLRWPRGKSLRLCLCRLRRGGKSRDRRHRHPLRTLRISVQSEPRIS